MELTGKCKEDFDKYWEKQTSPAVSGDVHHFGVMTNFKVGIKDLTESMQYGVYVDFFDSVGIYISLDWYDSTNKKIQYFEFDINNVFEGKRYNLRSDAMIESIKQSNTIYNER